MKVERLKGETKQVASVVLSDMSSNNFFNTNISVSMKVDGKKVGCTSLGSDDNVSFSNVDDTLLSGGIGVSTWLPTVNTASVELQSVKVESL
jgi:CRISPR/Cas system-associated exonuclease Cas4 (RecB family)